MATRKTTTKPSKSRAKALVAPAAATTATTKPSAQPRRRSLRLHGTIARDLGVQIVSGRYRPGDLLNGEIDASDRLQVSRSAYREAVRILAAKGLVESRPKVGTRVSQQESWHLLDPDVLAWIFEFEPEDTLLNSLFELRKIVEPAAAALAAKRRTKTHLAAMQTALADMSKYTLAAEEGRRADQNFHAALLRASGNVFLMSLTSGVGAAITWTTIFKQRAHPLQRDAMPDHIRVFDAVAASDAAAAHQAMTDLINLAQSDTTNSRRIRTKATKVESEW